VFSFFLPVLLAASNLLGSGPVRGLPASVKVSGPQLEEGEFRGKVVVVYVTAPAKGAVMEKVCLKQLGGRRFLVGSYVRPNDRDDTPDMTLWYPVDALLEISVFNSVAEVRKAFESQPHRPSGPPAGQGEPR
jgi:hypothetical protein